MPRLTMNFIATKIQPPVSGQVIIGDDALPGFGLRVTPGSMTYIAESRINGKVRRVTIGRHGKFTPESARKAAREILVSMATGKDPTAKHEAIYLTLEQAFGQYMQSKTFEQQQSTTMPD